jgi:Conserved TM helix
MTVLRSLAVATGDSLRTMWGTLIGFLPSLIGALAVLIIGLVAAKILERITVRLVEYLKIDSFLRRTGVEPYFDKAHVEMNIGRFIAKVVYWFIVIVFLLAASDILHFAAFSYFLRDTLIPFIPNVLVAVLIILASFVVANFLRRLVVASVNGAGMHHARSLGVLAWWVIIIFGFLSALLQIGVAITIINTLLTGIIAMLALAGGLAFGLGGKERAARFLEKVSNDISNSGK